MTAALFFVPLSSPGTSPPRQAEGPDSTDAAGLFAILLAAAQPAEAGIEAGAQPVNPSIVAGTPRSAIGSVPADAAPRTATVPAMPMPVRPDPAAIGPATAVTLPAGAALPLSTPPTTAPVEAGLRPGISLPQLDASTPPTQELRSPAPDAAERAERTRTAAAPPLAIPNRTDAVGRAPGEPAAPPRPAITADQLRPTSAPGAAPMPHAVSGREAPIVPLADAQVPIAADGWSPQSITPRRVAGAPAATPRSPSIAASGATAMPASQPARSNVSTFGPTPASPGAAADQPAASDRVGLEPAFEGLESALGRSEQSPADPIRPPVPGRTAPPAPMFQIGVQIAKAVPARIDHLFVQLEPAALGRVEVRLEFHGDNRVSAMIAAERPDTLDALQRDARLLERSLHEAGLRLDSAGLTFSLKREQAQADAREHRPFALAAEDAGDQSRPTMRDDAPPPLHWFRGLRVLDIRI